MNFIPTHNWFTCLRQEPLIIAGPCSAETENQVLSTAMELSDIQDVKIFRAGIWKPRTRPNNFEGVGKEALNWLVKVKQQTKLLTAVEVAMPEHIEHCLNMPEKAVDIFWIGARTVANPFSVQELANALRGVDIPVMVKNPINPDFSLWVGALERFYKSGIEKLAAIHRGFFPFEDTSLRNIPKWEIPIELKSRFHKLPIICDPSHIAGDRKYIAEISQKALDLNMDGLMLETHINPQQAWSDAKQQITPNTLKNLLANLQFRQSFAANEQASEALERYRNQIDSIDFQMLELLAERMKIVEKIGVYKNKNNLSIFQLRRWENIKSTRKKLGKELELPEKFINDLLSLVHKESIHKQTSIFGNTEN